MSDNNKGIKALTTKFSEAARKIDSKTVVKKLDPRPLIQKVDTKKIKTRLKKAPKWFYPVALGSTVLTVGSIVEMQTSFMQSLIFTAAAENTLFSEERQSSPDSAPMANGPYDVRHGYDRTLEIRQRLTERGFDVTGEGNWHERNILGVSLFPIYQEKSQAGLTLLDQQDQVLYDARFPRDVFATYTDMPDLLVQSLLYVETRELINDSNPRRNPAIEWERLFLAIQQSAMGNGGAGGSTLATQTEKFRHSPGGETSGDKVEKFRQMLTASVRAYEHGTDTTEARHDIVLNYVNAIPLSAVPGFGEVHGFSDGLRAWFGKDPAEVSRLLALDEDGLDAETMRQKAIAYRETLSIVMAVKMPTTYLRRDRELLETRIDNFLPLLAEAGIISEELRDATLGVRVAYADPSAIRTLYNDNDNTQKARSSLQIDMMRLLGLNSLYDLDRYDISARTTLDVPVDAAISEQLHAIADPEVAASHGLVGYRLLPANLTQNVTYTFTMYERLPDGRNVLRVQADNFDGPFNLNEDSKLELGSTAKLRTMVTYMEAITALYEEYSTQSESRRNVALMTLHPDDNLTRFVLEYLGDAETEKSLEAILDASLDRTYSGNPNEDFFTGGGVHPRFSNFDNKYNGGAYSVRESLQRSLNLPFVRIMRDIVNYTKYQKMDIDPEILSNADHPARQTYLERFADRDGSIFLYRGWSALKDKSPDEILNQLASESRKSNAALAAVYRSVHPDGSVQDMESFVREHCTSCGDNTNYQSLYDAAGEHNWNDRGWLTKIHPMTLWVAGHLAQNPDSSWAESRIASASERIEIYQWLIDSNNQSAQNTRIRIMMERDAFEHIHRSWQNLGFPFERMVPSYASALGSSGDTPAALSTLAGILQNDGMMMPSIKFTDINFATNTPYELNFASSDREAVRVLPVEIARLARAEMQNVVERGTARRAFESVSLSDGTILSVGMKTGTGDNRRHNTDGTSEVQSRTATIVYTIDDRFYGSMTAFVEGPDAARYNFTSGLTTQIFKSVIAPQLTPLLDRSYGVTAPELQASATQNTRVNFNF